MVKIGIIGLGFMGSAHIKAYLRLPQARIVAICNPSGGNLDGDFSKVSGNIGAAEPLRLDMSKTKVGFGLNLQSAWPRPSQPATRTGRAPRPRSTRR